MSRPRVLFLAHLLPWPLQGGGQIKTFSVLEQLAQVCDIRLLSLQRPTDSVTPEALEPLRQLCALGVETVPLGRTRLRDAFAATAAPFTGASFLIQRDHTPALKLRVEQELAQGGYAAVHLDHLAMWQFLPQPLPKLPLVLDQHNIEHQIPTRLAQSSRSPLWRLYAQGEAARLRRYEQAAVRAASLTLAVSEHDRAALEALAGPQTSNVRALPLGIDVDPLVPPPRPQNSRKLLILGTLYWPPNIEGILWFCREVFPLLIARDPGLTLELVGARPSRTVQALARHPAISVHGSVPDILPFATECAVFLVPLLSGSGVRVKLLQALALGLPTVSTSLGAEGIAVRSGEHLLLADTPAQFAEATWTLLQDPQLGAALGSAGRRLIEEQHSTHAMGATLQRLYRELLPS